MYFLIKLSISGYFGHFGLPENLAYWEKATQTHFLDHFFTAASLYNGLWYASADKKKSHVVLSIILYN